MNTQQTLIVHIVTVVVGLSDRMSGIKKKWTKVTNKEKREWSTVLLEEVAAEIEKAVPKSKIITPGKLAERYKISLTVARKVLKQLEADGKIVCLIKSHTLVAYGKPAGDEEEVVEEVVEEVAPKNKQTKGKGKK